MSWSGINDPPPMLTPWQEELLNMAMDPNVAHVTLSVPRQMGRSQAIAQIAQGLGVPLSVVMPTPPPRHRVRPGEPDAAAIAAPFAAELRAEAATDAEVYGAAGIETAKPKQPRRYALDPSIFGIPDNGAIRVPFDAEYGNRIVGTECVCKCGQHPNEPDVCRHDVPPQHQTLREPRCGPCAGAMTRAMRDGSLGPGFGMVVVPALRIPTPEEIQDVMASFGRMITPVVSSIGDALSKFGKEVARAHGWIQGMGWLPPDATTLKHGTVWTHPLSGEQHRVRGRRGRPQTFHWGKP